MPGGWSAVITHGLFAVLGAGDSSETFDGEITIATDRKSKTLTVSDNGIGLSADFREFMAFRPPGPALAAQFVQPARPFGPEKPFEVAPEAPCETRRLAARRLARGLLRAGHLRGVYGVRLDFAFWCVLGGGARDVRAGAALCDVARGRPGRRGACGAAPGAFFESASVQPNDRSVRPRGAPERSALAVAVSRALGHHFDGF